jgi:hypothetical protein
MKNFTKKTGLLLLFMISIVSTKINAADITTTGNGNWSAGTTWSTGTVPTASDNVFIQLGHNVTVDIPIASCNDLNINIGTATVITIGSNTLEVSGKLRGYSGLVGTIPGTSAAPTSAAIITTSGVGKLKFIGLTRNITNTGEWAANPSSWNCEFALNAGQEGTLSPGFKAGVIDIVSGTLIANSGLRADGGSAGSGTLTVRSGATLRIGNSQTIQRINTASGTSHFATFTLESGGILEYRQTVGTIGASTVNLLGTVIYNSNAAQTLLTKGGNTAGADPNIYNNITIDDAGTRTLGLNTTVNGILSLRTATGAVPVLNLGAFALTYGSTATLQYRGIGSPVPAQTTTNAEWPEASSGLSMPPIVDIFNQSNVILNSNKSVDQLKLSGAAGINAKLVLGANNITVNNFNITNPDEFKYVVTNSTGKLIRNDIGSTPVSYPIGTATNYHPVTIANTGTDAGTEDFGVNVTQQAPAYGDPTENVDLMFDISEGTVGSANCAITMQFSNAASQGGAFSSLGAKIAHVNAGVVDYVNGTSNGSVVSGTGFTNFSPFFITSDAEILPVKITSFTAAKRNNVVSVNWAVANQVNIANYVVEKSNDGIVFSAVKNIAATNAISYAATDETPFVGSNYYRLRIVEKNGAIVYSTIAKIDFDGKSNSIKVFPTITNNSFTINTNSTKVKNYSVISAQGKVVLQGRMTATQTVNIASLPTGTYQVKVDTQNFMIIKN